MGISKVYLDSYYLLELVKEGDRVRDVRRLLYKLSDKNNAFEVHVSQIALGEAFAVIYRDFESGQRRDMAAKLMDVMERNGIYQSAVLPKGGAFSIMAKLQQADEMLDATDTMIVSNALADRHSKFFFTNDSRLLGNREIIRLEKNLKQQGKRETDLKIQDGFTS